MFGCNRVICNIISVLELDKQVNYLDKISTPTNWHKYLLLRTIK